MYTLTCRGEAVDLQLNSRSVMQREGERSSHSTTHPRTLSTLLYLEIFVTKKKKKKKKIAFSPSLELRTSVTVLHSLAATQSWDTPSQFSRSKSQGSGRQGICNDASGAAPFQSLSGGFVVTISITNTSLQTLTETYYYSPRSTL